MGGVLLTSSVVVRAAFRLTSSVTGTMTALRAKTRVTAFAVSHYNIQAKTRATAFAVSFEVIIKYKFLSGNTIDEQHLTTQIYRLNRSNKLS